jgi:hypothetical protein
MIFQCLYILLGEEVGENTAKSAADAGCSYWAPGYMYDVASFSYVSAETDSVPGSWKFQCKVWIYFRAPSPQLIKQLPQALDLGLDLILYMVNFTRQDADWLIHWGDLRAY